MVIQRFDVWMVDLDPAHGSEIRKRRPCLVVSPEEMNRHLRTVLIAPMTTKVRRYPSRVPCRFGGKSSEIALDQMRAIDRERLIEKLGVIGTAAQSGVLSVLAQMLAS